MIETMNEHTRIVVMGPSGAGKSTVGAALARALGADFIDADDLHPERNIAKMRAGVSLDDADRWPWLDTVGAALRDRTAVVVACSALKRSYRDAIRRLAPDTWHIELTIDAETLTHRMNARSGHFMPESLLQSQLSVLEPLAADERGMRIAAEAPVSEIVAAIRATRAIRANTAH